MQLSEQQTREQSIACLKQWGDQWRKHAKIHSRYKMKSIIELENSGIGKAILLIANGFSFEENLSTIREHQDNVDIMCCDKTLGHCLANGIKPKYCLLADANVSYELYLKAHEDLLQDTILLSNVCANPDWTKNGNWKEIYFYVNQDVINSQIEFGKLSGCPNLIPAGTNVSNGMVVMATQSGARGRNNFMGYDKILLIGFDYSWRVDGSYYAFDKDGRGKAYYMRHVYCQTLDHRPAYSSNNLVFSAKWLVDYIKTFRLPVVQCSKSTLLNPGYLATLEEQMQYKSRDDSQLVRDTLSKRNELAAQIMNIDRNLNMLAKEHHFNFRASV